MKSFHSVVFLCCALVGILSFSACKKITEDQIINGLWRIQYVHVGPTVFNYLDSLPHYSDGNECCFYKLDFERDGVVIAYYLTYDSLNSINAGTWSLISGNEIELNVGDFLDGTFEIEKPTPRHWNLTSEANHIRAYDGINPALDTAWTSITMKKL
jgi:hypothetical protein